MLFQFTIYGSPPSIVGVKNLCKIAYQIFIRQIIQRSPFFHPDGSVAETIFPGQVHHRYPLQQGVSFSLTNLGFWNCFDLGSLLAHYFWDAAFALYAKVRGLHKVYMDKDDYHEWRDGTLTQQTLTILILIFHVFICLWLYNVPIMDTVSEARKWLSEVSSMELLNRIVAIYLVIINIITFITFGIDKRRAVKDIFPRIRIRTLLILAAIGGSVGGILGMKLFRHKTRKKYFSIGMPLILIIQIFLLYFLFYKTV